jgi:hypothetical protein
VLCDGTSAVFVPQIVANLLGYPPRITIAIDDCGQREFAKIERDDLFGGDGLFLQNGHHLHCDIRCAQ